MLSLYKSSAGSGKTHTLVLEYLKIVLAQPEIYRNILAVTFTNKATDEMKSRIISALSDLATQPEDELGKNPMYLSLSDYFSETDKKLPPKFSILKQARKALSLILNDYSNFSVSTIESFFQKILRAFARELNIPLGYDVETKNKWVLDRLVDGILLDVGQKKDLTKLLARFVDRNLEEEKTWNLEGYIRDLGNEIFKEEFQGLDNASERLGTSDENYIKKTLDLAQKIWAIRKRFEGKMEELAKKGIALINEFGLKDADFAYGKSGVISYFYKSLNRSLAYGKKYEPGPRVLKGRTDVSAWYSKKSDRKEQVENCVTSGLQDTLEEMISLYERDFDTYNTALQASMSIFSFGLLTELKERLAEYRKEHGQLIISDTGLLLQKVIMEPPNAPFIYEKVGTRFQHFLLDEFQDTSNMQWGNMLPLLLESLSYSHFNMLVGDAKQSIYRWRNGNMELLLKEVEKDIRRGVNQQVKIEQLDRNWRTASEIVAFNNWLFDEAAARLAETLEDPTFTTMVHAAYGDVAQIPQRDKFPGYVELNFLRDLSRSRETPGPSWETQAEQGCMELIWELVEKEGFLPHEITLLVRNNIQGTRLATFLQKESAKQGKQIQVVSADSLLIRNDPRVQFLHALLQYLNDESHEVNAAALSYYYHEVLLGEGSSHTVFREAKKSLLPFIEKQKSKLRRSSVYECIEKLCQLFEPLREANAYIQGFKDAALTYAAENDPGISSFLTWWEIEKNSRAIASAESQDAVQIMTIHKSKGLEFPIVILPFAEWEMPPKASGFLWVNPQKDPYQSFTFFPMRLSDQLSNSWFKEAYKKEEQSAYLDNLNLLYVALTRPKYRLYLFSKAPSINKKGELISPKDYKSISKLLYKILAEASVDGLKQSDDFIFSYGKAIHKEKIDQIEGKKKSQLGETLTMVKNGDTLPIQNQTLKIKFSSNQFLHTEIRKRDELINRGELLHEGLSYIESKGDLETAVQRLLVKGMIMEDQRQEIKEDLGKIISNLAVQFWYDGSYTVKNEAEIIQANGKVWRPDRVMLTGNKAIVVDYKSGKPNRKYIQQMENYIAALFELGYKEVEGYLYYILVGHVEKISSNPQLNLQF